VQGRGGLREERERKTYQKFKRERGGEKSATTTVSTGTCIEPEGGKSLEASSLEKSMGDA